MVSLILPAYNEAKRIEPTLIKYSEALSRLGDYEIIVIANGCTDSTSEVVEKLMQSDKNLRLEILREKGKGLAIIHGLRAANGYYIGYTDADGALSPDSIIKLFRLCENDDCDIIIGSRNIPYSISKRKFVRKYGSYIFNLLVRYSLSLPFRDVHGSKVLKSNVASNLSKILKSKSYTIDIEILVWSQILGYKIKEIPVIYEDVSDSRFKPYTDSYELVLYVIKLAFQKPINNKLHKF